jgi:hypothetical protein
VVDQASKVVDPIHHILDLDPKGDNVPLAPWSVEPFQAAMDARLQLGKKWNIFLFNLLSWPKSFTPALA